MRAVPPLATLVLALSAGSSPAAAHGNPPGTGWTPDQKILGYVEQSPELTRLLSLLKAAGLTAMLRGHRPVTLLAPTDTAFAGLPPEMLQDLQLPRNKPQLLEILGCLIIRGRVTIGTIAEAAAANPPIHLTSVTGCRSTVVTLHGQTTIDDANGIKAALVHSDVTEANGMVQVIDAVLTPAVADIEPPHR